MNSSDRVADVGGQNASEPSTLGVMDGDFDTLVEKLLDEHHVPGMSIAIVHNGKIQCKV
jgi:CubicO group peptidase (beta-lactamase class C family)